MQSTPRALGMLLVGTLLIGCSGAPMNLTAGATSETASETVGTAGPTGTPSSTDSTDSTDPTASSTSGGGASTGPQAPCPEGQIYICRLDDEGQCSDKSGCESNTEDDWSPVCELGTCTDECEERCDRGWDCVDQWEPQTLTCSRDYEEWCNIWDDDCPQGSKCTPWASDGGSSWNAYKCTPLDPDPDQPGEPCEAPLGSLAGVDTCDVGSMCWNVDGETKIGTCVAYCTGSPDSPMCAQDKHSCTINGDGILTLCLPWCEPLLQDCSANNLCLPAPDPSYGFLCVLDASGETGAFGDPCEYLNACDPGLMCVDQAHVDGCEGTGCCSPMCDLEAVNTCPGEMQECVPWYEPGEAPPDYDHFGFCGIP